MTPESEAPQGQPLREAGWRRFLPALAFFLLLPLIPSVRMFAPIQETIVLLTPSMAVATLLGWRAGGRLLLPLVWTALAVWTMTRPVGSDPMYDAMVRSWSLLLATAFGVASLAYANRPLFPRALVATALTFAMVGGMLVVRPDGVTKFSQALRSSTEREGEAMQQYLSSQFAAPEWKTLEDSSQTAIDLSAELQRFWREEPSQVATISPALLGLESLAALALVWGLFHRVSRVRLGPPLSPLREFRFNDQLVWGLVVGITIVVLPTLASLRGFGLNLLAFFGVLYSLRGLGVLSWFLAPRRIAPVLLIVLALIALPFIGLFSLGLGLGDTWFDLRRRVRPTS